MKLKRDQISLAFVHSSKFITRYTFTASQHYFLLLSVQVYLVGGGGKGEQNLS